MRSWWMLEKRIIAYAKVTTTAPIEHGFSAAVDSLLEHADPSAIQAIYVGTTHATNALLQQQELYRVGVIRLAGHHPMTLPPCFGWPNRLKEAILGDFICLDGGFECDGRPLTPWSAHSVREKIQSMIDQGVESLAITGVFSPLYSEQELQLCSLIRDLFGERLPISLSHQIGGMGFIERENATILNAALKKVIAKGFVRLQDMCKSKRLDCRPEITQNNGSIISVEHAIEFPVLTLSAGPTNSFIGGTKLAGFLDAIVVDIGGTSTDLGIVQNGFPRRCLNYSNIGGVTLNFSMPDVLSIPMGGGSHINLNGSEVQIGPESSARKMFQEALSFGGTQLTLTDIAICMDQIHIAEATHRCEIDKKLALRIMDKVRKEILYLVSKIEMQQKELPIVLVGGGASLLPAHCFSERFHLPKFASVANAYGAALAEVSATIETVVSLDKREAVLEELKRNAIDAAVSKGASASTCRVVDLSILPYHYMPGNRARVRITAAG